MLTWSAMHGRSEEGAKAGGAEGQQANAAAPPACSQPYAHLQAHCRRITLQPLHRIVLCHAGCRCNCRDCALQSLRPCAITQIAPKGGAVNLSCSAPSISAMSIGRLQLVAVHGAAAKRCVFGHCRSGKHAHKQQTAARGSCIRHASTAAHAPPP